MANEFTVEQRSVIKYAKEVSGVLLFGTAAAIAAVCARLFGEGKIDVGGISVPLGLAWGAIAVATVAHVFLGAFFLAALNRLWVDQYAEADGGGEEAGQRVFDEITLESNIFLRGMIPRAKPVSPGSRFYRMRWDDPSTWIAHGAVILGVLAVLPWRVVDGALHFGSTGDIVRFSLLAVVLAVANWLMGATWAVALSQLTVPSEDAHWHYGYHRRKFGFLASGGYYGPFG